MTARESAIGAVDAEVHALLADVLGRFEARHAFPGRRGGPLPRPADLHAWRDMCELGLIGLTYPAEVGGLGAGAAALGAVARAVGRGLLLVPFFSSAVLVPALVARLNPDCAALRLDEVVAGTRILALAHAEPRLGYASGPVGTAAAPGPRGNALLTGDKVFVLDAPLADAFLISATDAGGDTGLFLVELEAEGVTVQTGHGVDERPLGTLRLRAAEASRIGGIADAAIDEALDRGALAACAEALGAMEKIVEATLPYLRSRRAFGQTLSQFQVLRHRCADMHVALEEVRAVLEAAEQAEDAATADRAALLAACKVTTCRNGRFVAEQGVQLHGGIGVTDDLDISHLFKRLMMLEACFGDGDHHLARRAAALFAPDGGKPDAGEAAA